MPRSKCLQGTSFTCRHRPLCGTLLLGDYPARAGRKTGVKLHHGRAGCAARSTAPINSHIAAGPSLAAGPKVQSGIEVLLRTLDPNPATPYEVSTRSLAQYRTIQVSWPLGSSTLITAPCQQVWPAGPKHVGLQTAAHTPHPAPQDAQRPEAKMEAPPVRLCRSQASTVPSRQVPACTACWTVGTCSASQRNL